MLFFGATWNVKLVLDITFCYNVDEAELSGAETCSLTVKRSMLQIFFNREQLFSSQRWILINHLSQVWSVQKVVRRVISSFSLLWNISFYKRAFLCCWLRGGEERRTTFTMTLNGDSLSTVSSQTGIALTVNSLDTTAQRWWRELNLCLAVTVPGQRVIVASGAPRIAISLRRSITVRH